MKQNAYLHDITDTFGEGDSSKEALSIAKKIKFAQKKAFPSIEFKQHLGDRLSNIYALQSGDNIAPRFSITQLFGAFASFIFIAGGVFAFYQMQEITDIEIQGTDEILSIPNSSYDMQLIPSKQYDSDDISNDQDTLGEEIQSIQVENEVFEQGDGEQNRMQEIVPETTEFNDTLDSSNAQTEADSPMMRNMQFDESNIDSGVNEDTIPENMMNARMSESSLYRFESMDDENIPNIFSDLCETYMGEYNYDTQICTLQFGSECFEYDEDTLYQCYVRDNSLSE